MNERKHILLIFPSTNIKTFGGNESDGTRKEKTISPPLGILYLSAELADAGYSVEACDFNAEDYFVDRLLEYARKADLAGISMLSFNREHSGRIISTLNKHLPNLPVIVGGPDLILHPRLIDGTLLSVVQEAENIIVPLVKTIFEKGNLSSVPGIVFRGPDGTAIEGKPFAYNDNLDTLKFPRRELLRDNKGYNVIGERESRVITSIITSRGCPRKCAFCAHGAIAYQKYRVRSAANVIAEFELIIRQGYRVVGIVDDNFTANKKRAIEILNGIIALKTKLTLVVQGRVDAADPELFSLMRRAGVKLITFGLESGNQDVLDFYNKGVTVEQSASAIRMAHRAGLYTAGLFIFGAPFETEEHFERTYRFAADNPLDVTSFWILDYTYGSKLWADAFKKGIVKEHEFNVPAGKERQTSPYPSRHIEKIAGKCFFRFYRRPEYWLRQIIKFWRIRDFYFLRVLGIGAFWLINCKVRLIIKQIFGKKVTAAAVSQSD